MRQPVSDAEDSGNAGFQKIVDGFLLQPGLPFEGVLSSEKINRIFRKHGGLFGGSGIYNTAIVLWAFLGQVLRDGKDASCQAAVAGIISFCLQVERDAPTEDTGDYYRARAKLSEPALRQLSAEIANEAEQQADAAWLWKGRHAKLADGFAFMMIAQLLNHRVDVCARLHHLRRADFRKGRRLGKYSFTSTCRNIRSVRRSLGSS